MSQGDVEARVVADTSGLQAGMVQAAVVTEAQMKSIARSVMSAMAANANLAKTAQSAASTTAGAYASIAANADHVRGAHAGVNRELLVLAHEMSQGNYSRFGGSMLVLAERTNALEFAMTGAGAAALGVGAALIGFVALVAKGAIENDKFNKSLIETNNFAGLTADSLGVMAHQVAQSTGGTIGNARAALEDLAKSGKFGPGSIDQAAQAVVQMERVTGESAAEIVKDFAKMSDGVAKWAAEHNQQFHYLTATQYEYIRQLENQGNLEQAEVENLKLLTAQFGKVNDQLGYTAALWRSVKQAVSDYADQIASVGRPQTVGDQIDMLDKQLARMREAKANPDHSLLNTRGDLPATDNNIAMIEEQRRTLMRQQSNQQAMATAQAQAGADQQAGVAARQYIDGLHEKLKATSALTEALEKYRAEVARAAKAGSPVSPEQQKFDEAGIRREHTPRAEITQANEYTNIIASIKAFNQVTDEEIGRMGKLTDGQKFSIQAHEQLTKAGKKLSEQQRETILSAIDEAAAHRTVADMLLAAQKATIARIQADTANQEAQQHSVESVIQAGNDQANAILRQSQLIGKSADQVLKIQELQKFDDLVGKALLGADNDTVQRILQVAAVLRGNLVSAIDEAKTAQDAFNASFMNGWDKAQHDYIKQAANSAATGEKVFADATNGMTDALVAFAETGKLSFKSLISSMIGDLIRLEAQKGIAHLMGGGSGGGASSGAGSLAGLFASGSGSSAGSLSDLFSGSFGGGYFANGLDYVPYDGFPAILHEGEKVSRRQDAAVERAGGGRQSVTINNSNSFGAGVDASTMAQALRSSQAQTKADIYRSLQTGSRR